MSFVERHGLWQHISAGKECVSCQTTPNNWFTAVHHRETPERLKAGQSVSGTSSRLKGQTSWQMSHP